MVERAGNILCQSEVLNNIKNDLVPESLCVAQRHDALKKQRAIKIDHVLMIRPESPFQCSNRFVIKYWQRYKHLGPKEVPHDRLIGRALIHARRMLSCTDWRCRMTRIDMSGYSFSALIAFWIRFVPAMPRG